MSKFNKTATFYRCDNVERDLTRCDAELILWNVIDRYDSTKVASYGWESVIGGTHRCPKHKTDRDDRV